MRIASIETDGKRILLKKGAVIHWQLRSSVGEDWGGPMKNKIEAKRFLGKDKGKKNETVVSGRLFQ